MKNLLFGLAFMLVGGFAFAKSKVAKIELNDVNQQKELAIVASCTVTVYDGDGNAYTSTVNVSFLDEESACNTARTFAQAQRFLATE